jgi:hypothetical protein
MRRREDLSRDVPPLEEAVSITKGRDWRCLAELAKM